MNYLQRDPRNGTVILVNLRERIWETEGRRWRWNRFFIGYFSKLFEFQSHLHAVWLHAHTRTHTQFFLKKNQGFPGGSRGKESSCQCRRSKRHRCIAWVGISPGGGNGNLLQYSCLENPRDGGAWWAAVYGVAQSWTQLKRLSSSSSSSSRKWQPAPVFLSEKSQRREDREACGQRSLSTEVAKYQT